MSERLVVDPIQSLAGAAMGAAYMGIGPAFDNSVRMVFITNYTDDVLVFSWNGVDDHFHLPIYTGMLLTVSWNEDDIAQALSLPKGSRLYAKEWTTVSSGTVYVTVFRGVDDA